MVKGDFVKRIHLYEAYKQAFPEERVKRTALGKRKWFQQLQTHLGQDGYFPEKSMCQTQRHMGICKHPQDLHTVER